MEQLQWPLDIDMYRFHVVLRYDLFLLVVDSYYSLAGHCHTAAKNDESVWCRLTNPYDFVFQVLVHIEQIN